MEELRNFELLYQGVRFLLSISRIDGHLVNNIAVRIRYGLCHSIYLLFPRPLYFWKKKRKKKTNDRGKILWQAQSGYELPFSTICTKIEWARRWGGTACDTIETLPHLTPATGTFYGTWEAKFLESSCFFSDMPCMSPSFILCEITLNPAYILSAPRAC